MNLKTLMIVAAGVAAIAAPAAAQTPVTSGLVVRGMNAPPPVGLPHTPNGRVCDFSREDVDQSGRMTGASVQCLAGGNRAQLLANLPLTFNSYCIVDAKRLNGRLITAPITGNPEHCDLSALKPKDAQTKFGGGKWR